MRIISSLRLACRAVALRRLVLALVLLLVIDSSALAQNLPNTTRLLRFPAINDRQIVFVYAGELYTVPRDGGTARRLTSGPGYSSFPRFSPDGAQLAFTSPIRRQHRGLRDARRGRRAEAPYHDRDARAGRCLGPDGPEQHRHDVDRTRNRSSFFAPG